MPYRLFIPRNYDPRERYPLVVWLHGATGRGRDNRKQLMGANAWVPSTLAGEENQERFPSFVVAPQCPPGRTWDRAPELELSRELELVIAIVQTLEEEFSIDGDRIYVVGQSMGAFGAWSLAEKRPDLVAAVVPMCGGGNPVYAERVAQIPLWVFHGKADTTVPVRRSREMVRAVREAGGKPLYTEYRREGHDVWEAALDEPNLLPWLFSQSRASSEVAAEPHRAPSEQPTRVRP